MRAAGADAVLVQGDTRIEPAAASRINLAIHVRRSGVAPARNIVPLAALLVEILYEQDMRADRRAVPHIAVIGARPALDVTIDRLRMSLCTHRPHHKHDR